MKSFNIVLAILVVIALFPMQIYAQQVQLPLSKLVIAMPEKFDVYELDLGAPFGKSDVIMDESKNKVISFMVVNDKNSHANELMAGVKSGLKKQRAVVKESVVEVNKIKLSVLGARIGENDQVDKRIYVFLLKQHLIILSQAGFDSFHDDKLLQLIMKDLAK